MKKIFAVLLMAVLALSACNVGNPAEELPEEPQKEESQLPPEYKVIDGCVFESKDGKYGVQSGGKVVAKPEYDEYKKLGRVGGTDLYALGKIAGTKPWILYGEDEKPYGVGEKEKILYDIYSEEGKLILPLPVDDAERYDKETLFASLDGDFYTYTFSDEGEIIGEKCDAAGKTGEVYNGLEEVCYCYDASPFSTGYGLVNAEGTEVVPMIYSNFDAPFDDRIIARKNDGGFGFWNTCRILDNEGNIICDKYHDIQYYHMGGDEYVGIGEVANPQSQVISVCYDENGEMMTPGKRFVDKDGNELSEVFEEDIVSAEGKIIDTGFDVDNYVFTA